MQNLMCIAQVIGGMLSKCCLRQQQSVHDIHSVKIATLRRMRYAMLLVLRGTFGEIATCNYDNNVYIVLGLCDLAVTVGPI